MYINELLDLTPINLELWDIIDGEEIYSNQKIHNFVTEWVTKSKITKSISKKITQGIDRRKIVIGYESPSKMKFLFNRIWRRLGLRKGFFTLGYFSKLEGKIVILLDDSIKITGRAIYEIPPILVHELCHFAANQDYRNFIRETLNHYLLPFYSELVRQISENTNEIPSVELIKILIQLSQNFDAGPIIMTGKHMMEVGMNLWGSYFHQTDLKNEEITQMVIKMLSPFKYIHSRKVLNKTRLMESMENFHRSYKIINIDSQKMTTPGQEALLPSEVVAISNEFNPRTSVIKLINSINFRGY